MGFAMKVLLINPPSADIMDVRKKCLPPYNLLCLGTAIKRGGYEVKLLETNALELKSDEVIKEVVSYAPDVIGIPVLTEILSSVSGLIQMIKKAYPKGILLAGGAHVTARGTAIFDEFPLLDYALCGESDLSIIDFLDNCKMQNAKCKVDGKITESKTDLSKIAGLIYRQNGTIVQNPIGNPPLNLDELGLPDYSLLDDVYKAGKYYIIQMGRQDTASVITSRGCPYSCGFCGNIRGRFRGRSAESVVEELVCLKKKGIKIVDIVDTNFTLDRARAMRVFGLLIKENVGISFRFKSRVDLIDEEMIKAAKAAGAHLISYGMESGSQRMLDIMQKGTTVKQNARACEITKRAGLLCHAGWCLGYPGETRETIEETTNFIIMIKPTTASIAALMPYPGTKAYVEAKENGTLMGEWSTMSPVKPWIKLPWLNSYEELSGIVQHMKKRVYYRPFYIKNFAKQVFQNLDFNLGKYIVQEALRTVRG